MSVGANASSDAGKPKRAGLFLRYAELRKAVWALRISTTQAYLSTVERGEIEGAPLQPERVYLASWRGWEHLLWREAQQLDAANAGAEAA